MANLYGGRSGRQGLGKEGREGACGQSQGTGQGYDQDNERWIESRGSDSGSELLCFSSVRTETKIDGFPHSQQLFNPPLGDYQFLIQLDASVIPRHYQAFSPNLKALVQQPQSSSVVAGAIMGDVAENKAMRLGWDPVADFVRELEVRPFLTLE